MVAGAAVLALVSAIFIVLGALPQGYAFLEQAGSVLAPLFCVPVFSHVRQAYLAREMRSGSRSETGQSGYRFLSFALVAALFLTALSFFFNSVSIWQKSLLFSALRQEGVSVDDATLQFEMGEGDDIVVAPLLFLAGIAVGWRMRVDRVPWPLLSIAAIFVIMAIVRTSHLIAIESFWVPTGAATDPWTWSDFWSDILTYPIATVLGCLIGYMTAALLRAAVWMLRRSFPAVGHVLPSAERRAGAAAPPAPADSASRGPLATSEDR